LVYKINYSIILYPEKKKLDLIYNDNYSEFTRILYKVSALIKSKEYIFFYEDLRFRVQVFL